MLCWPAGRRRAAARRSLRRRGFSTAPECVGSFDLSSPGCRQMDSPLLGPAGCESGVAGVCSAFNTQTEVEAGG